jgi:hypothetical protein
VAVIRRHSVNGLEFFEFRPYLIVRAQFCLPAALTVSPLRSGPPSLPPLRKGGLGGVPSRNRFPSVRAILAHLDNEPTDSNFSTILHS